VTRTQLQAMSTRELIEHCRRIACPHETTGDLLLELASRLNDEYAFISHPQPSPETTGFLQEV